MVMDAIIGVVMVATAIMWIELPIVVITNTDSDGSGIQKYSLFFCATFQKIGDSNSHVRNFKFARKIWPDRFRRIKLCEIYATLTIVRSESELEFQPLSTALQRPKKKLFRLEKQCKPTPRNTKMVHGGFSVQVITKLGAFSSFTVPYPPLYLTQYFLSEAASELCA